MAATTLAGMAYTIGKEFTDPAELIERQVGQLASWLVEAKHLVFLTGAGISTDAGISDVRGRNGALHRERLARPAPSEPSGYEFPTVAHVLVAELVHAGLVKFVISTNTDDLHQRTGIPAKKLSAICGTATAIRERTTTPGRRGARPLRVPRARESHGDGASGERLSQAELERCMAEVARCDLLVCLGCSMTSALVQDLVLARPDAAKLVVCTRQDTALDEAAALCIHSTLDTLALALASELRLSLPRYVERRSFIIGNTDLIERRPGKQPPLHHWRLIIKSVCDGPAAELAQVTVELPADQYRPAVVSLDANPFELCRASVDTALLYLALHFERAPGESQPPFPPVTVPYELCFARQINELLYELEYDPVFTRTWTYRILDRRP